MGIFNNWFKEVVLGIEEKKPLKTIPGSKKTKTPPKNSVKKKKTIDSFGSKKTIKKKIPKVVKKPKSKVDSILVKKIKKRVLKKKEEKAGKKEKKEKKITPLNKIKHSIKKFEGNPIIVPSEKNRWESKATFNPAVLHAEGKVHLLYRAMGDGDVSVLGYMSSKDGFTMGKRLKNPVYFSSNTHANLNRVKRKKIPSISYVSGGGLNGGCEDPRLTLIEDNVYLTYTSFDGWGSVRMALSSIPLRDFLKKKWDWKKPIMISPPGEIHKNWVLFPEKIGGKFAVLHSVNPDIHIEYLDDLDFKEGNHINGHFSTEKNKDRWDSWVRGAGPPPIKTKEGWLLIYHAMDIYKDPDRYKMGAMLLDLKDPSKIIARTKEPILEPDMHYENEGWKAGVSYCCGATIKDDQLLIYYGGADKFSCVATADADKFIKTLLKTGKPKIKKIKKADEKKIIKKK